MLPQKKNKTESQIVKRKYTTKVNFSNKKERKYSFRKNEEAREKDSEDESEKCVYIGSFCKVSPV